MKKIFAIALALVMVLSMASAFASACVTGPFDWACSTDATNCGKATIEVIPYVNTNASCNGNLFVENDCAAAINGENVYYAVRLTVDADVDPEWWDSIGKVLVDYTGLNKADVKVTLPTRGADDSEDGWVFYWDGLDKKAANWHEATEDDNFDVQDYVLKARVKEYAKAKVCASFEAAYTPDVTGVRVGNFVVKYAAGNPAYLAVYADDGVTKLVEYKIVDEKVVTINYTAACGEADYAAIKAFMGLEIGTCVTDDAVKANFGWKEEVKSCYEWKTQNATAIVDTECVVAIPKTGDASVLAWLF
ncbi:MAG: hypothetical protein IKU32_09155 [Clostridia bacterium]|nr:hypothetical protein [Clostridia bacterium]